MNRRMPTKTLNLFSWTSNLVRKRSICELFLSFNGLSPEWSWNVARVLQSMIGIQCQSNDEVDLIEKVDIKLTGMGEATALAILEHLLVHHMSYILRSLESQATSTDNWDIEIPELKEALSPNSYKHYVGMKKNILLLKFQPA